MRHLGYFGGGAALILFLTGCGGTPPFLVERSKLGDRPEEVSGDTMKLSRPANDDFRGIKGGFHVVKSAGDWQSLYAAGTAKEPPTGVDFGKKMVWAAGAESNGISKVKIVRLVETSNTLHVYARETMRGEGCIAEKGAPPAADVAVSTRIDKPIKVHVEVEQAPSCGAPPAVQIACKVEPSENAAPKVTANPGDSVVCDAKLDATGAFVVVDRTWNLADLPGGSLAKLTFLQNSMRVKFPVDAFGDYTVHFEAVDESGRRGKGEATVNAYPPSNGDVVVQLGWAGFDLADDPSTFPRVALHLSGYERGAKGCTLESSPKPEWCEMKAQGALTHARIKGSKDRKFPVSVHYTDDRFDGGPYVCVRTYLNGQKVAESCDRQKRPAESIWDLGVLDGSVGEFVDPKTLPPEPPPPDEFPVVKPVGPKGGAKPAPPKPKK